GKSIPELQHLGGWESGSALRYIRDIHLRHAKIGANIDVDALRRPLIGALRTRAVIILSAVLLLLSRRPLPDIRRPLGLLPGGWARPHRHSSAQGRPQKTSGCCTGNCHVRDSVLPHHDLFKLLCGYNLRDRRASCCRLALGHHPLLVRAAATQTARTGFCTHRLHTQFSARISQQRRSMASISSSWDTAPTADRDFGARSQVDGVSGASYALTTSLRGIFLPLKPAFTLRTKFSACTF
ncbi:hypothetical protein V8E36_008043, partial [Tilletia maclaganii]